MNISAKVLGINKLLQDFKSLSKEAETLSDGIVGQVANNITTAQKQSAPADLGKIRQNLGNVRKGPSLYEIFSNAPESPYQEFGTGPQTNVPAQWAEAAAEFKGKGTGTWAEFILALTDWVKRHGGAYGSSYSVKTRKRTGNRAANNDADTQAAWLIARAILRRGLKPQPFFYHNLENGFVQLQKLLEKGYKEMENKYKKL